MVASHSGVNSSYLIEGWLISPRRHIIIMNRPAQSIFLDPSLLTNSFSIIDAPFLRKVEEFSEPAAQMHVISRCLEAVGGRVEFSIFEIGVGVAHD